MKTIAVFARWPESGQVKTRLSPALPAALACQLQRAMLADTLAAARAANASRRVLCWADAPDSARLDEPGFATATQRGEGLGARLTAAFADQFRSDSGPVVIAGCDAPEITAAAFDAAFVALAAHDLVLGPTPDGGYYLIGLARLAPGLFEGISWSTERARVETQALAAELGLTTAALEPLADVDTPADLVALIGRLLERPGAAAATAAALAEIGLLPPRR